jgi:hypothetical protein
VILFFLPAQKLLLSTASLLQRKLRGPALVDAHSEKMKDQKKDPKADMIWDHERDMSLGGRLLGDSERNKMIRDARSLGDRFGSSKSGGFL